MMPPLPFDDFTRIATPDAKTNGFPGLIPNPHFWKRVLFERAVFICGGVSWFITLAPQVLSITSTDLNSLTSPLRTLWIGVAIEAYVLLLFRGFMREAKGLSDGLPIRESYEKTSHFAVIATFFAMSAVERYLSVWPESIIQLCIGTGWLFLGAVDIVLVWYLTDSWLVAYSEMLYNPNKADPPDGTKAKDHSKRSTHRRANSSSSRSRSDHGDNDSASEHSDANFKTTGTTRRRRGKDNRNRRHSQTSRNQASNGSKSESDTDSENWIGKAVALYDYTANPDDQNEFDFKKGDILLIYDYTGKWWEAKLPGPCRKGVAPSNYLALLA